MPCNCCAKRRTKCRCKNALLFLEILQRRGDRENNLQCVNSENDSEAKPVQRKRSDCESNQDVPFSTKSEDDGSEKSCVCCACKKKLEEASKTLWNGEGYHSTSMSMNQLHKPEEHESRINWRVKLKQLLNENELEPISEDGSMDGLEVKPEPEVVAAALLTSEDDDLELSKIRPEDIFNKFFLRILPEEPIVVQSSALNSPSVGEVPVIVQGQSEPTLDTSNPDQEPQRLMPTSTPYRKDNQNLELPNFGSPIADRATDAHKAHHKDKNQNVKQVLKAKSPLYGNRVQLNGSVKPSWFPGFMVVSPLIPEYMRITSDPMEGLLEAWRLCQPRHFDEVSKSLVNTG